MRPTMLVALAGVLVLAGCEDPTKKHDMSCTSTFQSVTNVCTQLHVTGAEGDLARAKCEGDLHGSWSGEPCPTEHRMAGGHCKVEASQYSLSGTDALVYFYDPVVLAAAQEACANAGGTWESD